MPPLTYVGFLLVVFVPPIVGLAAATWHTERPPRSSLGIALLVALAVAYTTPWDNYLIAREVWSYGPGVVAARLGYTPLGEYAFFVLQTVLVGLWFHRLAPARTVAFLPAGGTRRRPSHHAGTRRTPDAARGRGSRGRSAAPRDFVTARSVPARSRLGGAVVWLALAAAGGWLLATSGGFYLGAILAWAGPVLALQWAVGGPALVAHRRLVALGTVVPALYLSLADRFAIALGLWTIAPAHSTGIALGGLPIEEAVFFLLTSLLVVQGLLLFHWLLARIDAGTLPDVRSGVAAVGRRVDTGWVSERWR
ncbi:hypothetical protein BRC90_00230 [Halobacteriales archaeon QS_4_69_34]|nr:MAG: hypothetical protein BRC90_00230 [Halobacteriales archaeon QS_4_69_34]